MNDPVARLSVKVFLDAPADLDTEPAIGIFHRWIQDEALEGLLIDVADYRHVHHGPAVMLIGDERDHVLDLLEGRPGVVCVQKRHGDETTLTEQIVATARRARAAADLLAGEPDIAIGGVRGGELRVTVLDRLAAPSGPEGQAAVRPAVEAAAAEILGEGAVVEAVEDPKGPASFRILAGSAVPA